MTKDHPAILWIYDVGIWDSPHSKFEPILLGCFGEKIVFVSTCRHWLAHFLLRYDDQYHPVMIKIILRRSRSSCDDQDHLEPKVLLASFRKMPGASGCRVGRKRPTHALNNLSGDDKSTLSSSSMTRTEHCVCFYSHHIVLLIFIS